MQKKKKKFKKSVNVLGDTFFLSLKAREQKQMLSTSTSFRGV